MVLFCQDSIYSYCIINSWGRFNIFDISDFKTLNIKDTGIVIFSGYNDRAILAFLRTALKFQSLKNKIYIIPSSNEDFFLKTIYSDLIVDFRAKKLLELGEIIKILKTIKIKKKMNSLIIMPTTESLIRFYFDNQLFFNSKNIYMPLTKKSNYQILSDKLSFDKLCFESKIKVPDKVLINSKTKFPVVIKPKKFTLNKNSKPIIINSYKNYLELENHINFNDWYFQKFIEGESIYLFFYIPKSSNGIYSFSQKNIIQEHGGGSIIAATSSNHHKFEDASKYKNLLVNLGFRGLIMIEVRFHQGDMIMIEANPRFWGPSQLFVDAGFNFFDLLLFDLGFINKIPKWNIKNSFYFWLDGYENVNNKKSLTYHDLYFFNSNIDNFYESELIYRHDYKG